MKLLIYAAVVALNLISLACADEWETLQGCRLIENDANDGDSFHVDADGEERIFRLYFVDAPETDSGGYVTERVSEQAREFGITEEESVAIGKKAAAFTRAVLSRPFKVVTRGQDAMGASNLPREYAFVQTADDEDLGEMLVSRGLARSFGKVAALPPYRASDLRDKYDQLEAKARQNRVGAWGDGADLPTAALSEATVKPSVEGHSASVICFGDLSIGATEEDFLRAYPRAQRGEDWANDEETLRTYALAPPDSLDADRVRFIFRKGRLTQMDHEYGKERYAERGGWQSDHRDLTKLLGSEAVAYTPDALAPNVERAYRWRSEKSGDTATLEVNPDGSAQVSFYVSQE